MAITWGSYDGHLRLGIDLTTTTPAASSTSVTVTVKLYVQCGDNFNFDDDQSWSLSGTGGDSGSFHNSLDENQSKLLYSHSFSAAIGYSGGPTYSYSARLSGAFNGDAPTHSRSITLPRRPPSEPSTPGAPTVSAITATTATPAWSAPAANGASLNGAGGQVSRNSGFTNVIQSWSTGWATSRTLTSLPKGTVLYVRVRAQNSEGWSSWSASRTFTTLTTAPSAPGIPAVSNVGTTSAAVAWSAPSDTGGASITSYQIQSATDAAFSGAVATLSDSASPIALADLLPGTTYFVRVRAINAAGTGAWSAVATFTTLSGVKVGDGTAWIDAIVWVGDGTKWVLTQLKTGTGTDWR
ncbi:fibronectin type III domain-containing protein [Actinoplanes sp. NPDC049265]|uniref:fibronectin type III domain-containing protein n=1 Tax=Actinoplanes sp. NPDC049265 TaxID=3363902 RepID=UPI003720EC8D